MMEKDELASLAENIKTNGLQNDLIIFENELLDGRNRLKACEVRVFDRASPRRATRSRRRRKRRRTHSVLVITGRGEDAGFLRIALSTPGSGKFDFSRIPEPICRRGAYRN